MVHSLWLQEQNDHLHSSSSTQLHSYKCLHLLSEIKHLYEQAPLIMLQPDCSILNYPLPDRSKNSTTASLHNFLEFAKPISIALSIVDASKLGTNFIPINSYFGPQYPCPPKLFDVIHVLVDPLMLQSGGRAAAWAGIARAEQP
jgi:hypothetical protein